MGSVTQPKAEERYYVSDQISEFNGLVAASCLPSSPSLNASIRCGYPWMVLPRKVGSVLIDDFVTRFTGFQD